MNLTAGAASSPPIWAMARTAAQRSAAASADSIFASRLQGGSGRGPHPAQGVGGVDGRFLLLQQ